MREHAIGISAKLIKSFLASLYCLLGKRAGLFSPGIWANDVSEKKFYILSKDFAKLKKIHFESLFHTTCSFCNIFSHCEIFFRYCNFFFATAIFFVATATYFFAANFFQRSGKNSKFFSLLQIFFRYKLLTKLRPFL